METQKTKQKTIERYQSNCDATIKEYGKKKGTSVAYAIATKKGWRK